MGTVGRAYVVREVCKLSGEERIIYWTENRALLEHRLGQFRKYGESDLFYYAAEYAFVRLLEL